MDRIIAGGAEKLHIITDFDRTLTQAFVDGEYKASLISVLYEDGYLSQEYQQKAQAMFAHYHPIEVDESIPVAERSAQMQQWREDHKRLLIAE